MAVKTIKMEELREYEGKNGLILQGCGGDPQEWINGINNLFTEQGLLLDGTKFKAEDCAVFKNGNSTCILFPFAEDIKLSYGKLSMWRLATHENMGGTWLIDFVDHQLGGFHTKQQQTKPDCPLIGQDGNIFNLMGIAARTLRENGLHEQSKEMTKRITDSAQSYDEALNIIGEYVNITSADDMDEDEGMEMCYE